MRNNFLSGCFDAGIGVGEGWRRHIRQFCQIIETQKEKERKKEKKKERKKENKIKKEKKEKKEIGMKTTA